MARRGRRRWRTGWWNWPTAVEAAFRTVYPDHTDLFSKIDTICREIYGADGAEADGPVREQLRQWEAAGFGDFPVCMAKTQYSFSTDPDCKGAPGGHTVKVREVRLQAGAGFVVAICGDIMTLPGLPRVPAANGIRLDGNGQVEGLF